MTRTFISRFKHLRPQYALKQVDALESLVRVRLQMKPQPLGWTPEIIKSKIRHFGLANKLIEERGSEVSDYCEAGATFFKDGKIPPLESRMEFYKKCTTRVMNEFYETELNRPSHLIHVSCTGYTAPNAAQELAAKWMHERSHLTTVTNAYHMGCYASLPALRIAEGLHLSARLSKKLNSQIDIVHQELCSIHFDPLSLEPEQIVVQSLFADGHIRYSILPESNEPGFELKALREEILPGTLEHMTWAPSATHFSMHLSREVPIKLKNALNQFVKALLTEAEVEPSADLIFAIHPGGPKIIEAVEKELELKPEQTIESHDVLREYGNMSSATLPHIWEKILLNSERKSQTHVVSLAFGPGLTLSGGVFQLWRQ